MTIRGDGASAVTTLSGGACASAAGSSVRFKVRASYSSDGSGDPSGMVALDFTTAGSCTPGKAGPRGYEVTSAQLVRATGGGGSTVLVFGNLRVTDDTVRSVDGQEQVDCVAWTLRVVIDGGGPRAVKVSFTLLDGSGNVTWTSGSGGLVEGSVAD